MSNILEQICEYKKTIITRDKRNISLTEAKILASKIDIKPKFYKAINNKLNNNQIAIIAEIKEKSPSQGVINNNFSLTNISKSYKDGGACAISVLTDEKYFNGKNENIKIVKNNANLPILRKDFIIDEYQIYQSKIIGADAILLIMSCLTLNKAKIFANIAKDIGLDILVETHNQTEIEQALEIDANLIGINNRNLKTLDISLTNVITLQKFIPKNKILICESGINSISDINILHQKNINAFLIGGFLLKQDNIAATLTKITAIS
jgi:indole-3-glycerol phosphate synthase